MYPESGPLGRRQQTSVARATCVLCRCDSLLTPPPRSNCRRPCCPRSRCRHRRQGPRQRPPGE
eukprot:3700486-Pyramimonas_sp.AAC.2